MAYDEKLASRVAAHFAAKKLPVEEKRMMGGLCFMVRGKMCVGVEQDRLMARIGSDAYDAALRRPGCKPMDFTGRPMRGFVFVDKTALRTTRRLASWLDLALAYNPQAPASKKRR
jgi:TfoX/Sxy family transcriptional regulator of competence genes